MEVLGIVGSPNRRGNTGNLVKGIITGADETGHDTIIFYLSELDINPLESNVNGYFYPKDDMEKLYPYLESMDALILGTPIYYDHVSSRTKLFIDRLHYYSETHGSEYRQRFPRGVKCINVITYEWDCEDAYNEVLKWMNKMMTHYWDMKISGNMKAWGTGSKPVKNNSKLLEKARRLGKNI